MAKITRFLQKQFGSTATAGQIGKFGSLAAGSPVTTTDPALIQSLSNWLDGWYAAVVGANSPAIEDMNAVCYLFARQLAYICQTGVPEWETGTTYYIGSVVNDGTGVLYVSKTDNNTGNLVSDTTNWKPFNSRINALYTWVIGTSAQVAAGTATHSSWSSMISAATSGDSVLVLSGSITENVSLSKRLNIVGQGYDSVINGDLTFASGSDKSLVQGIRVTGNVTVDSGVSIVQFVNYVVSSTSTITDNGTGSFLQGVQE